MKRKRARAAGNKGGHRRLNSNDFISQMPDEVIDMILSLMPIKDACVTSILSTRWRFLWRNLIQLNFDGTETLNKIANDHTLCVLERAKYIKQVNNVTESYKNKTVKEFRIRFDLDIRYFTEIDEWLEFALYKKVEKFVLDLSENLVENRDLTKNYEFPSPIEWPLLGLTEIWSLKEVVLKCVNMTDEILKEFLKVCPNLETLHIYFASYFTDIDVGGRDLRLKHFKLVSCYWVESVSLYDFDLVSFNYVGPEIELHFNNLPKLKEVDIGKVSLGLKNDVLSRISSCGSNIQVLYLHILSLKGSLNVNTIPQLPNVKKLTLKIGAEKDDSLLDYTWIAKACPRLETFAISLVWNSPIKRRRKVRHVSSHLHEHLKLFEISGYFGRISDLELAVYVIESSVALRKIVINCCGESSMQGLTEKDLLRRQKAARSSAKRHFTSILPPGVELAIL